jgi:hypothetical protein
LFKGTFWAFAAKLAATSTHIHGPGEQKQHGDRRERNISVQSRSVPTEDVSPACKEDNLQQKPEAEVTCSEKRRVLTDICLYPVKSGGAFKVK